MKIIKRLRSVLWSVPVEQEVREELAHHLELRTRELMDNGLTPQAAQAEAERRFGDLHRVEAQLTTLGHQRDQTLARRQWLSELAQDVTFALRQYVRRPGFTLAAIATLALGIGATTAIFSIVHAVILRPFPFEDPDRVLLVRATSRGSSFSVAAYDYFRRRLTTLDQLAAAGSASFNLSDAGASERVRAGRVTWNYFDVFGVRPELGRGFMAADDVPGAARVAILGHGLWQRRFGGDRAVVGRDIRMNGVPYQVVGVMPATFGFATNVEDVFVPIAFTPEQLADYDNFFLDLYGRQRSDVSLEQVNEDLARVAANLAQDEPRLNKDRGARATLVSDFFVGDYRTRLLVLLAAVTLVLVIACVNVANLLLAQLAARGRELALRAALGAGRSRIVRQLLTESFVLAAAGALGGLLLANAMLPALITSAPEGIPRLGNAALNREVVFGAIGLTLAATLLIGWLPAWHTSRKLALREQLGDAKGTAAGTLRPWIRHALIASQAALVLIVLAGAALLVRSAIQLQSVPLGFDTSGTLNARFTMPSSLYRDFAPARAAVLTMLANLQASVRVAAAAIDTQPPLMDGGLGNSSGLIAEGRPIDMSSVIISRSHWVTPQYFHVLHIPVRRGRAFTEDDVRSAPLVMIISESLARQAFGEDDPLGKRLSCCEGSPGSPSWKTVVGVVGDVRPRGPAEPIGPEHYLPLMQMPSTRWGGTVSLVARAAGGDAASLADPMREAVASVDPMLPVYDVRTMDEGHRRTMAQARFNTLLMSSLGLAGLLLAALGIYSVVAWIVSQRTREIGLRMALGASVSRLVRQMTAHALAPVVVGLAVGALGALTTGRVLQDQLFQVNPRDPIAIALVMLLMLLVAALAAFVPARRAARIDPSRALHEG